MSRTTTISRTVIALVSATVLAIAVLVAVATPQAAGADDRAERWAGYRIPATGRAAGGWIGGYRIGRTPVFVITPDRRPNRGGFRRADPTDDLAGRKGASRRETRRAAWSNTTNESDCQSGISLSEMCSPGPIPFRPLLCRKRPRPS